MAARGKRILITVLAFVLLGAAVAGTITGVFPAAARQGLYASGLLIDGGASTVPPGTFETPLPASPKPAPTEGTLTPVLAAATDSGAASAGAVGAKIASVDQSGMKGTFSGTVIDAASGKQLYGNNAEDGYIPASTMKLLTSLAALEVLGPDHRFSTRVVSGGGDRIVLVGGGDPYLAKSTSTAYPTRTSIAQLAVATAKALKADGRAAVSLGYDATLFSGPAWNPAWPAGYGDQVTPSSALWVDEGRLGGGSPGPRSEDPARDAAAAFAAALKKQGIKISSTPRPQQAAVDASEIATVQSMPLGLIIEQLLLHSDNDAAETVFRQVAIGAGKAGSIAQAQRVVRSVLTGLGAWDAGTAIFDGSGLSRQTRVASDTMVKVLRLALSDRHPQFRSIAVGLPVAGVDGSLRSRYSSSGSDDARGLVRAKTGTLRKVHALAGYVHAKDGSLLIFAFLVNNPEDDYVAVVWLDRVTSTLASCGCRT